MSRSKQKKKSRSRYQESAKEQPNEEEFCSLVQVQRTQSMPWLLILCVFFSGVAGLIYEVVWSRQLTLFLGTTAYAHNCCIGSLSDWPRTR